MAGKKTFLTATSIEENISLAEIALSTSEEFIVGWEDSPLPHPARYSLYLSEKHLIATFSCPIAAWTERRDAAGDFVSGLWEYDVAELFIYSSETKQYQEFNIAPSGAWWSALFSGYRTQVVSTFTPPTVELHCHSSAQGWNAAIKIPFSELALPGASHKNLLVNLCLIQGQKPRHYLSAALIETAEPDFHAFQFFLPVKVSNRAL